MSAIPNILLIDNNRVIERFLQKTLINEAQLCIVSNVHQASEAINCDSIDLIIIHADTYTINAATTCAWLKAEPNSRHLKLLVLTQNADPQKELKYYQAGADDVIFLPATADLIKHKILRHTAIALNNDALYKASQTLNHFYANTYSSDSLSHCMTECLTALQAMNLNAALHVCDHPELTCSSFGYVNDYEKALLSYAESLTPEANSARFTLGNETLSILVQDLPNTHHPLYNSLIDWVKKIFAAVSHKAQELLTPVPATSVTPPPTPIDVPQTTKGAQRLHYFVERALNQMETSCEQEINRSIGRVDELVTWPLTPHQKRHIFHLKDNLLQLKETLLTNCLEIESRYLQFITERRATTRLNLGW